MSYTEAQRLRPGFVLDMFILTRKYDMAMHGMQEKQQVEEGGWD